MSLTLKDIQRIVQVLDNAAIPRTERILWDDDGQVFRCECGHDWPAGTPLLGHDCQAELAHRSRDAWRRQ